MNMVKKCLNQGNVLDPIDIIDIISIADLVENVLKAWYNPL